MMLPALPLLGGCQCGAIRYEVRARPFTVYACHCTDCQKRAGAAFCMGMPVARESFAVTLGETLRAERPMPSGAMTTHNLCPVCHVRTHSEPGRTPAIVNVRPGTLDDTKWLTPVAQIWTKSAQPWALIPQIVSYKENPPNFDAMLAAFAKAWPTDAQ
jgi:hypothetical protein